MVGPGRLFSFRTDFCPLIFERHSSMALRSYKHVSHTTSWPPYYSGLQPQVMNMYCTVVDNGEDLFSEFSFSFHVL